MVGLALTLRPDPFGSHTEWISFPNRRKAGINIIPTHKAFTAPDHIYRTMLKMQLHIDQLTEAQFNKIARCDSKEVNTENLHTNTGFRKGVHWRDQCIKRNFYRIIRTPNLEKLSNGSLAMSPNDIPKNA